jgi:hypothetical protein
MRPATLPVHEDIDWAIKAEDDLAYEPPILEVHTRRLQFPLFQVSEQELKAYDMPISRILEENMVKAIQEDEDRYALSLIEGRHGQCGI